ncbi:Elongator complex protein 4 [Gautieria morchelliformis]|nr:Elongator complex protein 4 [Gautieria morchelliformis]
MSFKRRVQTQIVRPTGTRPSRSTSTVSTLSTGIPSFDDVLGGGLPLGSVLVVLAPDPNTSYAELVQRHFVSQGLASGQSVCILDNSALEFASSCMWVPSTEPSTKGPQELDEIATETDAASGVKIAWRYENMKKFQTSVDYRSQSQEDAYCHPLSLTCRIPEQIVNTAVSSKRLYCRPVSPSIRANAVESAMAQLEAVLSEMEQSTSDAIRLSIPQLGSPEWGDLLPYHILRFLHALRARLRQDSSLQPRIAAFVTLPSYLSQDDWGGTGWSQKLGWLSDGCVTLRSFSSDPALLSMFPSQHGLVSIQSLPAPHTLIPHSDKFSELRGLSTFSSSSTGGGENNLAFKCTRKRFIVETLHLDVEGGVNERRTTVPVTPGSTEAHITVPTVQGLAEKKKDAIHDQSNTRKKPKKTVAFQSDRPDLYDF